MTNDRLPLAATLLMAGLLCPAASFANSIIAYVEPPDIQSTSVANTTTETFNSFVTGRYSTFQTSAIGVYEATSGDPFQIVTHDQFGGSGGTGKYFAIGIQSGSSGPLLLQLSGDMNYFGFWWSAGDTKNSITFLENGVALATFNTSNLVTLLPNSAGSTVTAINGQVYNTTSYYGNPNGGQDGNEPFAYVDVVATGLTFNQVEFSNSSSISSGFESDNHSVGAGILGPPITDVLVQDVPLTAAAQTPEPASLSLATGGFAGLALILMARRRRRLVGAVNAAE